MKHGLISFDPVHVPIPMLIHYEVEAPPTHQRVPEVFCSIVLKIPSFVLFNLCILEFAPIMSPSATSAIQEASIPISVVPSINITSSTHPSSNICMMCRNINNGTAHEDAKVATQKDFNEIKSLASRLTVGIHTDEIEKKLLR